MFVLCSTSTLLPGANLTGAYLMKAVAYAANFEAGNVCAVHPLLVSLHSMLFHRLSHCRTFIGGRV